MKELLEYRKKIVERLEQAAREFIEACKMREAFAKVADGDWTVHQTACHTRDVTKHVYGERVYKTLNEDNPLFGDFDADKWMASHYDKDEPLEEVLSGFLKNVENLRAMLSELPTEAWSRESRHAAFGGGLTLQLWVERGLAHIEEHLKTLK